MRLKSINGAKGADLDIFQAVPDASIQISDSNIFPFEHPNGAGAGAVGLDFSLVGPPAYGGGVDTKDTGDLTSGQHSLL
jgi:hypothetical protein